MGFTKLFKQLNASITGYDTSYSTGTLPWKDRAGTSHNGYYYSTSMFAIPTIFYNSSNNIIPNTTASGTNNTATFFAIGSGNNAFSDDDYDLASRYTSGFSLAATHILYPSYNSENGKLQRIASYTVTAGNALTIKEIGLFKYVPTSTSNSYLALMYREVLETPIELAAGESITFTLAISGG